jgi:hypothetical protein
MKNILAVLITIMLFVGLFYLLTFKIVNMIILCILLVGLGLFVFAGLLEIVSNVIDQIKHDLKRKKLK